MVAKLNIPAVDDEHFDLHAFFPASSQLLVLALRSHGLRVLVHCEVGMSRSAAILAAYLLTRFAGTAYGTADVSGEPAKRPWPPLPLRKDTVGDTGAEEDADLRVLESWKRTR